MEDVCFSDAFQDLTDYYLGKLKEVCDIPVDMARPLNLAAMSDLRSGV